MVTILCIAVAGISIAGASVLVARYRTRHAGRDPLARVFRGREYDELDAHLEAVARQELRRLEWELARYLAGRAGYVVGVFAARNGIALELSDGRRLALRGICSGAVGLLHRRAPVEMLRPESLARDAVSYRLLLRGHTGAEIKIYARNVALAY